MRTQLKPAKNAQAPSVIIPACNDEAVIEATLETVLELGDPPGAYEVVVVNDCSSDGTWGRILDAKARHPEIHAVDFGEPYGEALAMREGARRASRPRLCFIAPGLEPVEIEAAIERAISREEAVAGLEQSPSGQPGAIVAQAFAAGALPHVDEEPARWSPELSHRSSWARPAQSRARRSALVSAILFLAVLGGLVFAAQRYESSAAEDRPSVVTHPARPGASTRPAVAQEAVHDPPPVSAPTGQEDGTSRATHPGHQKPVKHRTTSESSSGDRTTANPSTSGTGTTQHAGSNGPAAAGQPSPSTHSGGQQGGAAAVESQPPSPEAGATTAAPATPSPPDPPAAAGDATGHPTAPASTGGAHAPPPRDGGAGAPTAPPVAPAPAPAPTPPADPGAGTGGPPGNGNGHAYGQGNGNAGGNGNGLANGHSK